MTDATISVEAAIALLPPNKPTTLDRMRDAAFAEVARIEGSQIARMVSRLIDRPMAEQMTKRDDFFGVVRLIDLILSDIELQEIFRKKAAARAAAEVVAAPAIAAAEELAE